MDFLFVRKFTGTNIGQTHFCLHLDISQTSLSTRALLDSWHFIGDAVFRSSQGVGGSEFGPLKKSLPELSQHGHSEPKSKLVRCRASFKAPFAFPFDAQFGVN